MAARWKLHDWFNLPALLELGFEVAHYRVPEEAVFYCRNQVVFNPTDAESREVEPCSRF